MFLVVVLCSACVPCFSQANFIRDRFGAIVRGDTTKKEIALVFTGDEFADGGETILSVLKKHHIHASFFLTGKFYSNPEFKKLIVRHKRAGHYLGPHSDRHRLYADWKKRDSLLITESEFRQDMERNYERMKLFGINRKAASYFIPPYEWYNSTIVSWATTLDLTLVNFTPGTRSTADYTYPEMGKSYVSSDAIYRSIIQVEETSAAKLKGYILLIHIGTGPRRTDKFYNYLHALVNDLKSKGYAFRRIDALLR